MAIGAILNDGYNSGHKRVYQYNASTWVQFGQYIDGSYGNHSGIVSLSSDGTIVAIDGSHDTISNKFSTGIVQMYQYNGSAWVQPGQDVYGESSCNYSGNVSLSSDGSIVAIGANRNDGYGVDMTSVSSTTIIQMRASSP